MNVIYRALNELCVKPSHYGYRYIHDAVEMAMFFEELYGRLTKEIYPDIAKKYNKSMECVEKDIRTAVRYSWRHASPGTLKKYFRYGKRIMFKAPTNLEFILAVCEFVKDNGRDECEKIVALPYKID